MKEACNDHIVYIFAFIFSGPTFWRRIERDRERPRGSPELPRMRLHLRQNKESGDTHRPRPWQAGHVPSRQQAGQIQAEQGHVDTKEATNRAPVSHL